MRGRLKSILRFRVIELFLAAARQGIADEQLYTAVRRGAELTPRFSAR
jgi:hypothetical protein